MLYKVDPRRSFLGLHLKRVSVSYLEFLQSLLPSDLLTDEESAAVASALERRSPGAIRSAAQSMVRSLIARNELEVLRTDTVPGGRRLRLRGRHFPLRFTIIMDEIEPAEEVTPPSEPEEGGAGWATPDEQVTELPLEAAPSSSDQAALFRSLILQQGLLILTDRPAVPRDIVQGLEPMMAKSISADTATFLPVLAPPGEYWSSGRTARALIPTETIRDLARYRTTLIYVRDASKLASHQIGAPRTGSALYIGVGDDIAGWRGVLELLDHRAESFDPERIGLAVLLATHFQTVLASAVRLQPLLTIDPLTSLHNRPYFEDQLEKQVTMARRRGQSFAFCIIDIDDFKAFNTRFGYPGGDRALVTVGCVLKSALRASDTLARWGGEEFAVLLAPPVTPDEAYAIAERLRAAVETEPFEAKTIEGVEVQQRITISIGGAFFPSHGRSVHEIFNTANQMLIHAKHSGKNQTRLAGDTEHHEGPEGA